MLALWLFCVCTCIFTSVLCQGQTVFRCAFQPLARLNCLQHCTEMSEVALTSRPAWPLDSMGIHQGSSQAFWEESYQTTAGCLHGFLAAFQGAFHRTFAMLLDKNETGFSKRPQSASKDCLLALNEKARTQLRIAFLNMFPLSLLPSMCVYILFLKSRPMLLAWLTVLALPYFLFWSHKAIFEENLVWPESSHLPFRSSAGRFNCKKSNPLYASKAYKYKIACNFIWYIHYAVSPFQYQSAFKRIWQSCQYSFMWTEWWN